jgi:hypothetical protein
MNNYNWWQKKLHHLVLDSQFIREVTFDVESFRHTAAQDDNHVFIVGLARSGTTTLLSALYKANEFSSLSYADMPFVLAPNLWSKINPQRASDKWTERAHKDGVRVSVTSPEAFEEVFWQTFSDAENDSAEKFKTYVSLVNDKYGKTRYLSKNNQNIRRLDRLANIFPDSKILILFRDPLQHAFSLLNQHQRFLENSREDKFIEKYMKWIGHTEFGPNYCPIYNKNLRFNDTGDINHWLEQWLLVYSGAFDIKADRNNRIFICYEQLCESQNYWFQLLAMLGVSRKYDFKFEESQKGILLEIDNELDVKTRKLYSRLCASSADQLHD